MTTQIDPQTTVGRLVTENPSLSRVFEGLGIDYCCGGKRPVGEACLEKGLDTEAVLRRLAEAAEASGEAGSSEDPASLGLTELADEIERTHHAYLRSELPRLDTITAKVHRAHAGRDARLSEVRSLFLAFREELESHMLKEERVLFPLIRRLDAGEGVGDSLAGPVAQMESEHDAAGDALARMRAATDGFAAPNWACNTYRVMLDALAGLEADMHRHVHKENNILFPRALELAGAR